MRCCSGSRSRVYQIPILCTLDNVEVGLNSNLRMFTDHVPRSRHFIDPSLHAILDTALTADDNDLFLSNLVHTPILAIHGSAHGHPLFLSIPNLRNSGKDDNVPTWHSREAVSALRTWNPEANVMSVWIISSDGKYY